MCVDGMAEEKVVGDVCDGAVEVWVVLYVVE